jgi:hypothetical protein
MGVTTEPPWLNKTAGISARNGTTSRTITFSTFGDAPFTPVVGALLVVVVFGAVTNAGSVGWTEQLSPVNSGELSVFTKTAVGADTLTITNNGSNYPEGVVAYQFPIGSTYAAGAGDGTITADNTWNTLSGLTGGVGNERLIIAARARSVASTATAGDSTWSAPWVEDADLFTAQVGTDGLYLTTGHQINVTTTTVTPVAATTYTGAYAANDRQHVVFAINAVAPSAGTPFTKDVTLRWAVRNAFTKDTTLRWQVRNAFAKDTALVWSVRNFFIKDHTLRWQVRNAFVKDTTLLWNVASGWFKDVTLRWAVRNSFIKDTVLRWTVQPEVVPATPNARYLAAQRSVTAAFIADDPTTAAFIPSTRVKTATGGFQEVDGTPRPAQTFKLSLLAYDQRPTVTVAGVERLMDFHLIGLWDMQIEVGDHWTDDAGTSYEVAGFSEGWDYMVKAFVFRRVPREANP